MVKISQGLGGIFTRESPTVGKDFQQPIAQCVIGNSEPRDPIPHHLDVSESSETL